MPNVNFHGVYPALVTPFTAEQSLDEAGLRRLVRHLAPEVEGFVVNGTTGDFPLLSDAERQRAIEIVVEEVGATRLVIAGTGAVGTRESLALTRAARDVGAHAALVVAPYYLRPQPAGLRTHFATLAENVPDLPILFYNFPKLVGQPIPITVMAELATAYPNIAGLKDTSGDLGYVLAALEATPETFAVLVGQGTLLLPALALGAVGGVLAAANLIPAAYRSLRQAVAAGDLDAARVWQRRIYPVAELVGRYGSLAVRAGLEFQGFAVGLPRLPLQPPAEVLTSADLTHLQIALEALGCL